MAPLVRTAGLVSDVQPVGPDAAPDLLARHVHDATRRALGVLPSVDAQLALANRLLALLARERRDEVDPSDAVTTDVLLSLLSADQVGLGDGRLRRPGIPLRHSDLIINGPRDLRVGLEIARELPSADRVDLLMSFVKWSGLVELRDSLAALQGRPLRVLTTTYMGATDAEAVEELIQLGAGVRVSYDERRTRLHAKAWLFHRDSGFGTAIVGSSNLSHAALRDGCEWNVRLSQRDNPGLLTKLRATFDQYWDDPTFEPYERDRFLASVRRCRDPARDALAHVVRLQPYPHQQAVLDALASEREAGHLRNLVVAATGTGKTVIAALDYARLPGRPRLLFVAHRDRILDQSLATFRVALRDGSFGEKLTGRDKPIVGSHVFASIQSLHERTLRDLSPQAFEILIVDEFHHAAAETYDRLLTYLRPRLLLGLTATPERADGRSILHHFDGRVADTCRLWDALDRELLSPFQYFIVHDGTDISHIDFRSGRYDVASLERLYTADEHRATEVLRALDANVRNPRRMRALGFCVSVAHALFMQAFFERHALPARVVEARTPPDERDCHVQALERGEICCIFTVDVFNEGVDIPRVDTVLFLRPTESATLFLQQFGRGLRTHAEKNCLTVLDFVGNAHRDFRFDLRFRALLGGGTRREMHQAVDEGFPRLPSGCSIHLDRKARDAVLANLRRKLSSWAALADDLEPATGLAEFLRRAELTLEDVYRAERTFSQLRAHRGFIDRAPQGPMARALPRILHVDDVDRLTEMRLLLEADRPPRMLPSTPAERMLFVLLGQDDRPAAELGAFFEALWSDVTLRDELRQLLAVLDDRRRWRTEPLPGVPLRVHAHYTRAEVSAALDLVTEGGKFLATQAGVYRCEKHRCDLFFVTLDKDEKHFTPTTMYEDFVVSPTTFHWQSQSAVREDSQTGRRYRHPPPGWRLLLFVRRSRRDERGVTSPFLHLGPVRYLSHQGERPMSILWQLDTPVPGAWFQQVKVAAG